jgi:hypothetical protein
MRAVITARANALRVEELEQTVHKLDAYIRSGSTSESPIVVQLQMGDLCT